MRIRGYVIEYNLAEAARVLHISPRQLRQGVQKGAFQYFYRLKNQDYIFHDASIDTNRQVLGSKGSRR